MEEYYPITLDALNVNQNLLNTNEFRAWIVNYDSFNSFLSPLPCGGDRQIEHSMPQGVYLHWTLPRYLRTGKEDTSGNIIYPLLPNRWLITRYCVESPDLQKQWILECDCPIKKNLSYEETEKLLKYTTMLPISEEVLKLWKTPFDTKIRNEADVFNSDDNKLIQMAHLGVPFELNNWTERAKEMPLFLRTDSSGHPAFTGSYMLGKGIFGYYDDLESVGDNKNLDYSVIGWYSIPPAPQKDVSQGEDNTNASFFSGNVHKIPWNCTNVSSPDTLNVGNNVNLTVGNNSMDAFHALASQRFKKKSENIADQLVALAMDEVGVADKPNGSYLIFEKMKQQFFSSEYGGLRWDIIPAKEQSSKNTHKVPTEHLQWLRKLNENQQKFEEETQKYYDLAHKLFDLWWKQGRRNAIRRNKPAGPTEEEFKNELDKNNSKNTYALTKAQKKAMEDAKQCLPANPEEYAEKHGLDINIYELKSIGKPRYWKANTPLVLVAGVSPAPDLDVDLDTKMPKAKIDDLPIPKVGITLQNETELPTAIAKLYRDFMTKLDAKKPTDFKEFCQPWNPIFMDWTVNFYPMPFATHWNFDGSDYVLKEDINLKSITACSFSGISMLTPGAQHVLGDKISEQGYEEVAKEVASWPLLGQNLTDLDMMMSQRDGRMFTMPTDKELLDLVSVVDNAPLINREPLTNFYGICCGQMYLSDIVLYDKFGRKLTIIDSGPNPGSHGSKIFPVIRSRSMIPKKGIEGIASPILLPPRLPIHARLNMDLPGLGEEKNPVWALLALNPLDNAINLFSPDDGHSLGRLMLKTGTNNKKIIKWIPPANNAYTLLADLKVAHPKVRKFIKGLQDKSETVYSNLVEVLHKVFSVKKPTQQSNALMGRILALVECNIYIETNGEPYRDMAWNKSFDSSLPGWMSYDFSITLGVLDKRDDGLAGFFDPDNIPKLFSEHNTEQKNRLNVKIGKENSTTVLLLMDPQLDVTAVSGILPDKKLSVPSFCYENGKQNIEYEMKMAPVLTQFSKSEDSEKDSLSLPSPERQGAICTWWEKDKKNKEDKEYEISHTHYDPRASISLREGTITIKYGEKNGKK